MDEMRTEQLTVCFDWSTGLQAVIAIDDTTLGPGLGGVRWLPYPDEQSAQREARRLARAMTLKNACADLPYGGAKSVLLKDPRVDTDAVLRAAHLRAFGRFVDRLGGAYLPGADMGTSVADLAVIGTVASDVSCDREDPSPSTALGVFAGIRAALARRGVPLGAAHVVVQGTGKVGAALARLLAEAGCRVTVADVDARRAREVAGETGADVVGPEAALTTPCDVLAPCATARVVTEANAGALRCAMVVGGANDVLATRHTAETLAARDVLYIPDFVVNAGGVIQIHAVRSGWGPEKLAESVLAIGDRVAAVVSEAERTGRTPVAVAEELASQRLGRPVSLPD
jgi:leucine dehydrogenase